MFFKNEGVRKWLDSIGGAVYNITMMKEKEREMFYYALQSRDGRFDGRFFVGVKTTGIYCRPICPAPTPMLRNIEFYRTAAGAEAEGFRPCKRCRPDASPGTPVWSGTSATVSQALQLIGNGYLDGHNVAELGETLGVGDRQLRRLFKNHLGASPNAVALTRRLDFARKLIDETTLPMTEIAFASGFESIRRFNDAVKKRFDENPSELRLKARKTRKGNGDKNRISLELPYRPPLNWQALLSYLKGRGTGGVELIEDNSYLRSIRTGKSHGFIEVKPSKKESHLTLTLQVDDTAGLMEIVRRVRRIFDLDADLMCITDHLKKEPALLKVISSNPGLRVPGGYDNFEIAVRTVVGQHISVRAASTVTGRLVQRCGSEIENSCVPGITHLFPEPGEIMAADLSGSGLTGKRIETLQQLASRVVDGTIRLEGVVHPEPVKRRLMEVPGIGRWTAEYIAMRALREPDAFPDTDLVLKRIVKEKALKTEALRPWRAYAAIYLWHDI
jgi:AraC family transcriptional regulator, regulatory protein of adaptative response / DNA-3-methyladenine glycosylase II